MCVRIEIKNRQLTVKTYHVFIIILYFYTILYDTFLLLCHIYKKNNIGKQE